MCLDTVDEKIKKFEYGWKVFTKKPDGLYPECMELRNPYPINKWIKDNKPARLIALSGIGTFYSLGFHFFKTRKGARDWHSGEHDVIRKVLVKSIVASGTQYDFIVGVARQMKILE